MKPLRGHEKHIIPQDSPQFPAFNNSDSLETNTNYFYKNGLRNDLSNPRIYQNINQLQFLQQVKTPSWANNPIKKHSQSSQISTKHKKSSPLTNINTSSSQKISRISNISRLDELLSKNELIYQNMKNQLQQISKSNQNIRNNIKNIKPYSQSHTQSIQQDNKNQNFQKNICVDKSTSSQYKQPFTFTQYRNSRSGSSKNSNQSNQIKRQSNTIYLNNISHSIQQSTYSKQKLIQQKQNINTKTMNIQQQFNIPFHQYSYPSLSQPINHQNKKQLHKVSKLIQVLNSYRQPDSSPVASQQQTFIENHIKINSHKSKIHESKAIVTNSKNSNNDKYQQQNDENKQFSNSSTKHINYHDNKKQIISQQLNQKQSNPPPNQKNYTHFSKSQISYSQHQQLQLNLLPQPSPISLTFIPFTKLYSSPILQLSNKKQLLLSRKSKTQLLPNNQTNRIINGIKYKNINLIHDQIQLYQIIITHTRKIQQILKNNLQVMDLFIKNSRQSTLKYDKQHLQQHKNTIDIGIVGGQNTLKKKIHFSILAHIYADIVQFISSYLQNNLLQGSQNSNNTFTTTPNKCPSLILGISHQQQQSLGDPYIIKYEGQITQNQVQNSIVYANVKAAIEQIYTCMKMKLNVIQQYNNNIQPSIIHNTSKHYHYNNNIHIVNKNHQLKYHRIRVTKLYLKTDNGRDHQSNQQNTFDQNNAHNTHSERILYSSKIISTNKISQQLIQSLQLDSVIWCINPLYKYYQQTKQCLDCCNEYKNYMSNENKKQR